MTILISIVIVSIVVGTKFKSLQTLWFTGLFKTTFNLAMSWNFYKTLVQIRVHKMPATEIFTPRHERYWLTGTCLNGNSDSNGNYRC